MNKLLTILILVFFSNYIFAHHPNHKVEAEMPYPSINLKITKDIVDGYNLFIELNNFKLTPNLIGKKINPNNGYLNLYVNDIKIARVYSYWFHIPERYFNLKENIITVTLNSNMHGELTIEGKNIQANIKYKKD